jgi:hypothetical protein
MYDWFLGHGGTSNHTNALELYAPSKENSYPMYPKTPSDECHSYGTYEKNMDDLSDDFRNYEVSFMFLVWTYRPVEVVSVS